jgi:hypothetical protein
MVRNALDGYTRRARKRLRDGIKHRNGSLGFEVEPVQPAVAALLTGARTYATDDERASEHARRSGAET